jgi:hypothetical protein
MTLATGFRFSAISSSEPLRVPEDSRRWATDSDGEINPRHPDGATANSSKFSVVQYFSEQKEGRMCSLAVRLAKRKPLVVRQLGTAEPETASHAP